MKALSPSERADAIKDLTGWNVVDDKLYKKFEFKDFNEAWAFMSHVADWADEHNHHPEWLNVFNRVEVWLTTHDADGITDLDCDLAWFMNSIERG